MFVPISAAWADQVPDVSRAAIDLGFDEETMIAIVGEYHDIQRRHSEGFQRERVCYAVGSCDLCSARCEESRQYDGDTYWSQATAGLKAISAGYIERFKDNVRQLVCPACVATEEPPV